MGRPGQRTDQPPGQRKGQRIGHRSIVLHAAMFASTILAVAMPAISVHAQPDTIRIARLLKDGAYYVLKPGNDKKDLDSGFVFFNQALALSQAIHSDRWINVSLQWKGDCYLEGYDLTHGIACFQTVIDYYHRKGDLRKEAVTWQRLADCIPSYTAKTAAKKAGYYEHVSQLYYSIKDTLKALDALKAAADAHLYEPNPRLAEKQLLTVVDGYKALHFRHIHYTYDLLRTAARLNGDLAKELLYTLDMVHSMDSTDITDNAYLIARLYIQASNSFNRVGLYGRGLLFARKAWERIKSAEDDQDYFTNIEFIVSDLLRLDSPKEALAFVLTNTARHPPTDPLHQAMMSTSIGNCYVALGDYEKAGKAYQKLAAYLDVYIAHHTTQGDERNMVLALGKFYLLTHRYEKAAGYAQLLDLGTKDPMTLDQLAKIEHFRSQVDSSQGHYQPALRHFEAYQRINDSLFGVQKAVQIQELQIRTTLEQKEQDLRLQAANIQLLTKQNQLEQAQAGRSRNMRNMMLIGLLFLLAFIGLVLNRYRLKQRKNRQLETKQKEITAKNHELERLLDENEWLLREVHHRVKNNLQVIMSLLKSQSVYLRDEAALDVVMESQHRVYAMSLIHQKLYKSNDAFSIGMPEYVGDLVEYLRYSFQTAAKVAMDVQVQPITLDLHQAVPVGLILNEVITNSFKYAFPWSEDDRITVRLSKATDDDGWLSLVIADNGRGLPPGFDPAQNESFGMLLIGGLTEDLGGSLNIESGQGTAYHIRFPLEVNVLLQ